MSGRWLDGQHLCLRWIITQLKRWLRYAQTYMFVNIFCSIRHIIQALKWVLVYVKCVLVLWIMNNEWLIVAEWLKKMCAFSCWVLAPWESRMGLFPEYQWCLSVCLCLSLSFLEKQKAMVIYWYVVFYVIFEHFKHARTYPLEGWGLPDYSSYQ